MSVKVAPSILAADFTQLASVCSFINESEADWYHMDIMDGAFVPNISYGMPVLKAMKALKKKPFDVHLMIEKPERYIDDFKLAGADILTVHYEASPHLHRTLQAIKQAGMKAGVALNPHTPVSSIADVIKDIDLLLIMSVNPGFGGQKFIEKSLDRVAEAKSIINENNAETLIEVDGGVGPDNARALEKAGANVLVAGSAIFKAENPRKALLQIKG